MSDAGVRFATRLFQALPADRNLIFSPASIRLALAIAAEGARGETERELREAFDLTDREAGRQELWAQVPPTGIAVSAREAVSRSFTGGRPTSAGR